jgi:hypothetical protein
MRAGGNRLVLDMSPEPSRMEWRRREEIRRGYGG